jgi:hypothetical protein
MSRSLKVLLVSLVTLFFSCGQLFAQTVTGTDISVDGRYDNKNGNELGQARVKIGFVVDAFGVAEIVGLVGTGGAYNGEWITVAPGESATASTLAFRNLYLRKVFGTKTKVTLEAGALNGGTVVGAGGLVSSGWVDGIRVKVNTKIGDIKVVAGSLGDFKTSNSFDRKFDGNFLEIEISKKMFDQLTVQAAYENHNDEDFARAEAQYDLKILGDKVIKLFGKALYSFDQDVANYDVGVELDVLKTITSKFDKRLEMKVYRSYLSEELTDRSSSMVSLFYTYGPRTTFQLGGEIIKGKLTWVARSSFGDNGTYRHDIGVGWKISTKKAN